MANMTSTATAEVPAQVSPLVHVKRALGWNLGRIAPSAREIATLEKSGVVDPVVQRYAAWRRSLMLVAFAPTLVAFLLAALDDLENGYDELTFLGTGLSLAWLVVAAALPLACLIGVRSWTRPGSSAFLLRLAYLTAFLIPFLRALLPVGVLYHLEAPVMTGVGSEHLEKIAALQTMAVDFVLSGSSYLLLLPAVLSLIPGAMNGCLRIKSLLPAAQLPGWLLVCAAPAFLLFWLVILCVANHAAQSPLLVLGVLLWAGSPIWYALRGRVFIRSQISQADAAKIGGVKRLVGLTALAGILMMGSFVMTKEIAGLKVVGFDRPTAMSTQIEELADLDDAVGIEDVRLAYERSSSVAYALDLSNFRLVVDFLAKLLLITAIFADLILKATLAGWRNDRSFRASPTASDFDASAAAAADALSPRKG